MLAQMNVAEENGKKKETFCQVGEITSRMDYAAFHLVVVADLLPCARWQQAVVRAPSNKVKSARKKNHM